MLIVKGLIKDCCFLCIFAALYSPIHKLGIQESSFCFCILLKRNDLHLQCESLILSTVFIQNNFPFSSLSHLLALSQFLLTMQLNLCMSICLTINVLNILIINPFSITTYRNACVECKCYHDKQCHFYFTHGRKLWIRGKK